ncbi:putative ABC transport system permease protein [Kineothrix alysoides]|uniref:Putative ABC transport system permease protein n=1 Tax=Kineothrix alysoides TaxID=1469948 RepID=A0A4R1R5Z5_9FIRM|nr:FtsX-like permease family protein [Kineothrix alysoides]TCL60966.1 putative ABC transport system permease protein [Kineothrix alysoides]
MDKTIKKWRILPKLAWTGMIKNGTVYYPYIGAGIFSAFTYFIFSSILHNDIISILPHSAYAWMLLQIGRVLLGIILLPFLFYTNSFLIKRRKKEIGLYNILGLEKKHIGAMMFTEALLSYTVAIAGGIVSGAVFSKLLFLLLLRMTGLPVDVEFVFYPAAFAETAVFFFWIYAVNLISNLIQVGKSKPSELLSGSKKGEKEPKLLWVYAIMGAVILAGGYVISIRSKVDSMIFLNFFLAVFLVIIGTYFLFTSGSVAFLKFLKRNKNVYYKPANFITISGMFYRMKKNAASLVNICIFSTMVIITLVCTSSLYLGLDEAVYFDYPYDAGLYFQSEEVKEQEINSEVTALGKENGVDIKGLVSYERIALSCGKEGNAFQTSFTEKSRNRDNYKVNIITLEDYNRIENKQENLGEDEVFIFSSGADFSYDTVTFMDRPLAVKKELKEMKIEPKSEKNIFLGEFYIVVRDKSMHDELVESWAGKNSVEDIAGFIGSDYRVIRFNMDGEAADQDVFMSGLKTWSEGRPGFVEFNNNLEGRANIVSMYGGLLFIGILFSFVFLMCLLLIMYYKQISEGYEDRDSFTIMQKVGMSEKEIKTTIHRQILLVFFLPLLGAVLHTIAGLFMVDQLFATLRFFNTSLLVICAAAITVVFIAFYGLSYLMTAKTYYKIVRQGNG